MRESYASAQLYDQDNKVTVGERIVTSNISEKYVEGLFIGYISDDFPGQQ